MEDKQLCLHIHQSEFILFAFCKMLANSTSFLNHSVSGALDPPFSEGGGWEV